MAVERPTIEELANEPRSLKFLIWAWAVLAITALVTGVLARRGSLIYIGLASIYAVLIHYWRLSRMQRLLKIARALEGRIEELESAQSCRAHPPSC